MKGEESRMANNKRTNIKIKKSKYNLYNKKKSKSKRSLTWALTIVAACVLGVVGYGVGKPIYNYFQAKSNTTSTVSDSGTETNSGEASDPELNNSSVTSDTTSDNTSTPPVTSKDVKLCVLPPEAAASSASLNSALAVARESGYDTVAVTLKDEQGFLYYSSDIKGVSGTELIHGTLSAAQICDYITKAGMIPAVKISALKDPNTSKFFGSYHIESGIAWLDNRLEDGGKRWLSPFDEDTVKYIEDLTKELSTAGFRHIICGNITYPALHLTDITNYLKHLPLDDQAARLEALWNVADAAVSGAAEGGAQLWLEFEGDSFVKGDKFGTNAELASDKSRLGGVGIIADYSMSKAEDAYSEALEFAKNVKAQAGDSELAVLIKSGPSGAALDDIKRALEEQNIRTFSEN